MKSMLCKYYQPLRLEKPSNFRLVGFDAGQAVERDSGLAAVAAQIANTAWSASRIAFWRSATIIYTGFRQTHE